jgi:hypothetical protein
MALYRVIFQSFEYRISNYYRKDCKNFKTAKREKFMRPIQIGREFAESSNTEDMIAGFVDGKRTDGT